MNARARLSSTGLVIDGSSAPLRLLGFLDSVLRGVGQVMLQDNAYTGLIFLIGLALSSPLAAGAALFGAAAGTATASLLGAERAQVRAGLFGFNGALVAIALLHFLAPVPLTWACAALAAAGSTVVMAALLRSLDVWKLPALTAPFVMATLVFLLAAARLGRLPATSALPPPGLPKAAIVEGGVAASTIWEGVLNGVAQVFLQGNLATGALFLLGLLISSRAACVLALLGSLAGLLTMWGLGAAEPALRGGAFGFNSALAALALGGAGLGLGAASVAYGTLAAIAAAIAFAAMSAALQPIGLPALTAPFVAVVWLFLLAAPLFQRLRPGPDPH